MYTTSVCMYRPMHVGLYMYYAYSVMHVCMCVSNGASSRAYLIVWTYPCVYEEGWDVVVAHWIAIRILTRETGGSRPPRS